MRRSDKAPRISAAISAAVVLLLLLFAVSAPVSAEAKALDHRAQAHRRGATVERRAAKSKVKRKARPVSTSASAPKSTATSVAATATPQAAAASSSASSPAAQATSSTTAAPTTASTAPATSTSAVAVAAAMTPVTGSGSVTGGVARFGRVTYDYSSSLSTSDEASRYQFMVMQATDASQIRALKAANPNVKILLYQDPFLARPSDTDGLTVCSTWQSLSTQDTDWMLHDQNGSEIADTQEAGNYLMDVGNAAYQQSCVAHAIALAKQVGADGVMFDDANASLSWYLASGQSVPEYPSDASWQGAETSFLSYATAQLHASGLLAVTNVGGAYMYPGVWQKWSSIVDGSMEQGFNDWSNGPAGIASEWQTIESEISWSEAHGKYTLLQSSDNGEQENTFGVASMMLAANGMTNYSTSNVNFTSDEQWYATYAAAQNLGAPQGSYTELSNGMYERAFAHGMVIVNPSDTSTGTVTLPAAMTDSATGVSESTLTAAPMSGYVLEAN